MTEQSRRLIRVNDFARKLHEQSVKLEKYCDDLRTQFEQEQNEDVQESINKSLLEITKLSGAMKEMAEDFFNKVQHEVCIGNV